MPAAPTQVHSLALAKGLSDTGSLANGGTVTVGERDRHATGTTQILYIYDSAIKDVLLACRTV